MQTSVTVLVPSRTHLGQLYQVTVTKDAVKCSCPAGVHDKSCWHKNLMKAPEQK
jgi:hypothetical protein